MKLYRVFFRYATIEYTDTIEADTEDDALEIAAASLMELFHKKAEAYETAQEDEED